MSERSPKHRRHNYDGEDLLTIEQKNDIDHIPNKRDRRLIKEQLFYFNSLRLAGETTLGLSAVYGLIYAANSFVDKSWWAGGVILFSSLAGAVATPFLERSRRRGRDRTVEIWTVNVPRQQIIDNWLTKEDNLPLYSEKKQSVSEESGTLDLDIKPGAFVDPEILEETEALEPSDD